MRVNNKKVNDIAQAIGILIINGFDVRYEPGNEYGCGEVLIQGHLFIEDDNDFQEQTIAELLTKADDLVAEIESRKNTDSKESVIIDFDEALILF